ncbi:MAG: hypothetical protein ABW020_02340 [Candidatus Rokuibacteriota bacterium]
MRPPRWGGRASVQGLRPGIVHIPPKSYEFPAETITIRRPHASIDPGPFQARNTDLDKFSHGNFDVRYDPGAAALITTLRVEYQFESGITPAEQATVKQRLAAAVQTWNNAPFVLGRTSPASGTSDGPPFGPVTL